MQKLAARSNALCTGYCDELGALSHLLSAFSFPFSCPEGAVGRGGVIATPAAVLLLVAVITVLYRQFIDRRS